MDLNKKLEELKPYQLNCNVFDVYSYNGLSMQDLLCQFFTKINECINVSNGTIDLAKWLVDEGIEIEVSKKIITLLEDGTIENLINDDLFNSLNNKINNINTQIPLLATKESVTKLEDKKANKDDVERQISSVASGSPRGVYSNLESLSSAFPTGNDNIYLTLDNNNWNYWNGSAWVCGGVYQSQTIKDKSVGDTELNVIYRIGKLISGGINFNFENDILEITNGSVVSDYTGFYGVENTENILLSTDGFPRYIFFNIDTKLIHVESRWFKYNSRELLICCYYNKKVYFVGNNDLVKVNNENINLNFIYINGNKIKDNSIPNSKLNFASHYGCVLEGSVFIDTENKKIVVEENTIIGDMLGFYTVNEGEINFTNDISVACFLFFNKENGNVHLENRWYYSQNSNELFLGILYKRKLFNSISSNILINEVNTLPDINNQWLGRKWVSYGDSNTQIERWQPTVINKLGLNHVNMGVSSSTIVDYSTWAVPMCSDERLNEIPNDTDIITILGGTNDWVGHKPLGTIDSTDKNEFYGAYKYIIENIITRLPSVRLVLICPGYSSYTQSTGEKNNIGLTIRDYGNAIKEIGEYYNLPVIDLLSLMGVNKFNYLSCFDDEAIAVHFNVNGGVRVGNIVAETVKQL